MSTCKLRVFLLTVVSFALSIGISILREGESVLYFGEEIITNHHRMSLEVIIKTMSVLNNFLLMHKQLLMR